MLNMMNIMKACWYRYNKRNFHKKFHFQITSSLNKDQNRNAFSAYPVQNLGINLSILAVDSLKEQSPKN